jgi:outer membrane immunogenic protein
MIERVWQCVARRRTERLSMRWVIPALLMLALPSSAFAADLSGDFDVLRGSEPVGPARFTNWSGYYAGGQFSYGDGNVNFAGATQPLVAFSLRELTLEEQDGVSQWPVLGKTGQDAIGYGGFFGYNMQWQDLILGVELNYTHTAMKVTSSETPIGRQTSAGGSTYDVTVDGSGSFNITDFVQLRARAGWIFGKLMPYGFAGFVLGRADYNLSTLVFGQQNPSSPPVVPCNTRTNPTCVDFSFPNTASQSNALLYGFSAGGGMDVMLAPNVFARGELEFVQFAPISHIISSIVSARVGAGVKF